MMSNIQNVFAELNEQHIQYAILRGYLPLEELHTALDIDIYIPKTDFDRAAAIFENAGFKTPHINACCHPHVQYFLLTAKKLIKFDIVTELCFGPSLYKYVAEDALLQYIEKKDHIQVFRSDKALLLFLLHVVYDKGKLSCENLRRLEAFINDCTTKGLNLDELPLELKALCDLVLSGAEIEKINSFITSLKEPLSAKQELLIREKNACQLQKKVLQKTKWRYRLNRVYRKSVALIGVDGSGKSTTVKALQELLGDKCCIQYMGFREMETHWGKEYYASGKRFRLKILPFFGIYLEMWYRYLKNRFNNYKIIFYDRYPWEAYDNGFGKYKFIYFVLFKLFFPRPKKVYYLYCTTDSSFARKDDIANKELFINMKRRFDRKYKDKKGVLSFDTDKLTTEEILNLICADLMDSNLYEFLF